MSAASDIAFPLSNIRDEASLRSSAPVMETENYRGMSHEKGGLARPRCGLIRLRRGGGCTSSHSPCLMGGRHGSVFQGVETVSVVDAETRIMLCGCEVPLSGP